MILTHLLITTHAQNVNKNLYLIVKGYVFLMIFVQVVNISNRRSEDVLQYQSLVVLNMFLTNVSFVILKIITLFIEVDATQSSIVQFIVFIMDA